MRKLYGGKELMDNMGQMAVVLSDDQPANQRETPDQDHVHPSPGPSGSFSACTMNHLVPVVRFVRRIVYF